MKIQLEYVKHFKDLEVSKDYTLSEEPPPYSRLLITDY